MKKTQMRKWAIAGTAALLMLGSVTTAYAKENKEDYRAVFDAQYYYDQNPDLQESIGMNPEALFEHFATAGAKEGRSGNAEFNLKAYIYNNPDLFLAYKKNLSDYCLHYATIGKQEGRVALRQEEQGNIIGSWTTYYDETVPRAINVRLAAQRINGKILQPGERMSFSDSIMSRTVANGYVSAPLIKGYGIGGGICQVSSTLYAAMCQALMPAIERHPHSKPISYLPVGLDATISEGYLDLKFANNFDKPIQLL
ncbi:MAG: VanW family protein, partial [Lachnospiraceae bacterium]|nr:VanW family protein [Lachnospiraceae bacterium]